ncbi:MAG: 4-hydroxy-tetrahydrodipicolinate reductase [Candidatus Lokiarchaeota archaeon]|nr:4-hydroxy-tetrahydrodipicolinate reductase [Candidatus Lokiarchaeota archaeon]
MKDCPNLGMDIGMLVGYKPQNVKIESIDNLENMIESIKSTIDVFIDFTIADATEKNAKIILNSGISMVIGTTGLSDEFKGELEKIVKEKEVSIVKSTNMAVGVNVVFKIAAELAKRLRGWEIEIIEAHHHRKKDAPSGTALTIAESIADARNLDLNNIAKYGRSKGPNPRKWGDEEIGIHSVRGGDIVGDHTILYAGDGERIEFKHQAHSRECFASGALEAAKFLKDVKRKGKIFTMKDVLFP